MIPEYVRKPSNTYEPSWIPSHSRTKIIVLTFGIVVLLFILVCLIGFGWINSSKNTVSLKSV